MERRKNAEQVNIFEAFRPRGKYINKMPTKYFPVLKSRKNTLGRYLIGENPCCLNHMEEKENISRILSRC